METLGFTCESKASCQIPQLTPPAMPATRWNNLSEIPSPGLHFRGTTHSQQVILALNSIGRPEFNQLLPHHLVLESLTGVQVEWFANKAENIIGTIALTKVGRSWNYAILRRNKLGNFQVCDIGQNFFNLQQTMVQFAYAMVAARKDRREICPISD